MESIKKDNLSHWMDCAETIAKTYGSPQESGTYSYLGDEISVDYRENDDERACIIFDENGNVVLDCSINSHLDSKINRCSEEKTWTISLQGLALQALNDPSKK